MEYISGLSSPLLKQSWVVSAVLAVLFGQGMSLGFTSGLLIALQSPESSIKVTVEISSWIAASMPIGAALSLTIASSLISVFGRKNTMIIGLIPGIIGCLICFFAAKVSTLITGRFLNGLTVGSTGVLGAIVVGEYTCPRYRGVFFNLKNAIFYVGVTVVHVLGHYVHWRTVSLINGILFGLAFMMAWTWPQSPFWLAENRKYKSCEESFYYLRGITKESIKELKELIQAQKQKTVEKKKTFLNSVHTFLKKFQRRDFLKPVFIYLFAAMLMETSGRHVFPSFALQFIVNVTGDTSNSFYYNLYIDLIITTSASIATFLVMAMKRRTLLFSTGTASCIILLLVCLYLFLQSKDVISKDHTVVPLVLFAIYFVLVNLGCSPITLALVGEIFPLEHRPTGVSIAGVLVTVFLAITLKITPFLLNTINVYGTFSVFGVCMVISLTVMYFMLPETKDKTLQEIENYFHYGRFINNAIDDDEEAHVNMNIDDEINKS